ncbi:hypothetical protein Gpo141_00003059 [Globisporangium polare]
MAGSEELHGATAYSSADASPLPPVQSLVSDPRTTIRVSSVLDRNKTLYGAEHMLTADVTTCWNSAQGSPQQLLLQFQRRVSVSSVSVMFQGGFVGQDVVVHAKSSTTDRWEQIGNEADIEPEDANDLQVFPCEASEVNALRISFNRSTDFYGRVIIYRLDVMGVELDGL